MNDTTIHQENTGSFPFCESLTTYKRFVTREVKVGNLGIGGQNPIRIQSMTTTDTLNTLATVEQSIRMIESGCELVRVTAPSLKEAQNLQEIKNELRKRNYHTPLVADIHFTPNAAELAARIVEKVRVNPGNYADKKKFETIDYTDSSYSEELDRIRTRFTPLIKICKEYGTAMRIGTNHGSLSDRIMSRFGDTPLGMVESALEFVRICEELNFHEIVISMKSSNPIVMVQAYRLLVSKMKEENMNYPLHLGVTEAGEGEDGRIKSAAGIGTLLEDGLGDTIRVSLTEDPEFEAPVAIALANRYSDRKSHPKISDLSFNAFHSVYHPYDLQKRVTNEIENIGGNQVPRIIADAGNKSISNQSDLVDVGYKYSATLDKWKIEDTACDYLYLGGNKLDFAVPGTLRVIYDARSWKNFNDNQSFPLFDFEEYKSAVHTSNKLNFVRVTASEIDKDAINFLKKSNNTVLILETSNISGMADQRRALLEMQYQNCKVPVILKRSYQNTDIHTFQLYSATDISALLIDGYGDGVWIDNTNPDINTFKISNTTAFGILQATRSRISKTEYISCPSCGRTLFDLQETTSKIRSRTSHLKGIKIAIMGCIVNGPGEMADAHYGYVGTGVGKITLYKGKEVVKRNVNSENAVQALIELIKENGDWMDAVDENSIKE